MRVSLLLFGPLRDLTGFSEATLELPEGATVKGLAEQLAARYPALQAGAASLRFAVNEVFAGEDHSLAEGDEVAVIPPVSGGADIDPGDLIELSESALNIEAVRAHLATGRKPLCGGVCVFEGRTRLEQDDRHGPLVALNYEAYGSMALRQLRDLAARARSRWSIGALAIVHRVGKVPVGEPSVIIAVACAHRREAFEACRWLIDALKREVPIWKQEIWQSGESSWVDPTSAERKARPLGDPGAQRPSGSG